MTLSEPERAFVEQARSRARRTSRTIVGLAIAVALLAAAGAFLGYGYISERSKRTSERHAIEALQKSQQAHDAELEDVKRRQTILLQQLAANHITPDPAALLPATPSTTAPPVGRGKLSSPATTATTAASRGTSTTTSAPSATTTTTTAPPPSTTTTTSRICGVLGTVGPCKGGP